jgi:type I restriction enzyme M protein
MPNNHTDIEKRLWQTADELRANSKLKASEYSVPVLGLIFLKFADQKFTLAEQELAQQTEAGSRRAIGKADYQGRGVVYLPEKARFSYILGLAEGADIPQAINDAMSLIEDENEDLRDVLPKNYQVLEKDTVVALLKMMSGIPADVEGDAFGRIYEYFLGNFAMKEGQKGGEFFTPISLVKLIVEIIEPFHGRIFDPACGSGGMFVQSAKFVERHRANPGAELSIYGQEKTTETVRLCKMNLAVHGLSGDIREGNSYYEDIHRSVGKFNFVMANPPFNVNNVDKDKIKDDPRFGFGIPRPDNANYLWIQTFYSALAPNGRAGFVMANSAGDASGSELEIRRQLIQEKAVEVVISISPSFFYTVTLPCTLWFLDRGKRETPRKDEVLFIDARQTFTQIDRAHREFTTQQIEFLANIVHLYREEPVETVDCSSEWLTENFPDANYRDVPGLCKTAALPEISEQSWSLNPGRYVGVSDRPGDEFDFPERLQELNEELTTLNAKAEELAKRISDNVQHLLGAR